MIPKTLKFCKQLQFIDLDLTLKLTVIFDHK